jgi:hypothetical protein
MKCSPLSIRPRSVRHLFEYPRAGVTLSTKYSVAPIDPNRSSYPMKYLLLLYGDEKQFHQLPAPEVHGILQAFGQVTEELAQSGALQASEALQPTATATTVTVRDGKTLLTDGPFAETKEQLGGFYLLEAADLDAAIAWAVKIPSARYGRVEVRPVMNFAR